MHNRKGNAGTSCHGASEEEEVKSRHKSRSKSGDSNHDHKLRAKRDSIER